jgi:hypothetical protein
MKVHAHLIRYAVPDVTEEEIGIIVHDHPDDNPLAYTEFIPIIPESKEGLSQFYRSTVLRVMNSNDPIRLALLAVYTHDELTEDKMDGEIDNFVSANKEHVYWLRHSPPPYIYMESTEDSGSDLDD